MRRELYVVIFLAFAVAALPARAQTTLLTNEVDADNPSIDTQEFVELYDGGAGHTAVDGLVVVFFNGATDGFELGNTTVWSSTVP